MTDFQKILDVLKGEEVEFILIGGLVATVYGASRMTRDVDILYQRSEENYVKLAKGLAPYHPYLRGAPPGLPFTWDASTIRLGLNFTLELSIGELDLLGEVAGLGSYDQVLPEATTKNIYGHNLPMLSLSQLIRAKQAAGRTKDHETLSELHNLQKKLHGQ